MEISSLTYLYIFIPAALVIFNLTPGKFKTAALALISAGFLLLSSKGFFLVFAADIVLQYIFSEILSKPFRSEKARKLFLWLCIALNSVFIIVFSIRSQLSADFSPFIAMVISFTAIGYFVDLYKGETKPIHSFAEFTVFLAFFGKLTRGPLIRTANVRALENSKKFSLTETGSGLYLFIRGLGKYVILALPLTHLHEELVTANSAGLSVLGAWLDMIVFSMVVFFDLSGFCDMARGLGRCFGIELPLNFYYPFQSPTVADFLDRFNMTVTAFFRHYIYDVLRNDENSKPQFIVNTLLICMLCGIWFGIGMNFILWGLYIAVFIIIEEFFLRKFLLSIPRLFARFYTFVVTMLSMVIFSASDVSHIFSSFKAMFGVDVPVFTDAISFIVSQNMLILFIGAFFMISAFGMFIHYLSKKSSALYSFVAVIESTALLILITAELI